MTKTIGLILIILGITLTIFTSTKIFTKEKVLDIGNVEITRDKPHNFAWSPVLGIALIALGSVVLWKGTKN